uniref:Pentapeptide repeat-containing protein n=1 Tax=Candidatus Kentrum sp. LFY TaxID=2126342 RepID=A0A450U6G4_9GAMM|nr:MAG: Pentapeptide repeat-containing protein [Candidatus Kentron sp. LFY]
MGLYGIASTNYEAALDRVENRMGALASQLATTDDEAFKQFIRQIQRMETPLEPNLLWPFQGHSVFASLFIEEQNPEILQWTRQTIESWKGRLAGVNLFRINLSGAYLWKTNLSGADLRDIKNRQAIASIDGANILGIKDAPLGFQAWALENGAVEMEPVAWKAFLKRKRAWVDLHRNESWIFFSANSTP